VLERRANLGEAGEGTQDFRVIVRQMADDDVGVAEGREPAELVHHFGDRAPDESPRVEAPIARLDRGAAERVCVG
jgi:hypothetical protein